MRTLFALLLLLILSWWAVKPLAHQGFFPVHDSTQVARVHQMSIALKEGQFPVRWVPDLGYGYGYPLFNFYAPLPYYFAALLNLLGLNVLLATKIMFLIGMLLSPFLIFFLAKNLFDNLWTALLAAVVYLYAPYHALDIYVRGAVGEFWAMGLLPLLMLGIYKTVKAETHRRHKAKNSRPKVQNSKVKFKKRKEIWSGVMLGSFGLSGVILSHNITGMITVMGFGIFFIFYLAYEVIVKKKLHDSYFLLLTLVLGLGLAAFFWLPALVELPFTNVNTLTKGGSNFIDHFVYFDQLWASPWGYAGSAPGRLDGMSFMLGKLHIILAAISLFILYIFPNLRRRYGRIMALFLIIFFFSIVMTNRISLPIWQVVSWLAFVQFPWRFLVFATLGLSLIASLVILPFSGRWQWFVFLLLVFIVIKFNSKYFKPQKFIIRNPAYYTSQEMLQWETSKIFDEYMQPNFIPPQTKAEVRGDRITINDDSRAKLKRRSTTKLSFILEADSDKQVLLALAQFPGWRVKVNNSEVPTANVAGLIAIPVRKGKNLIEAEFTNTKVRQLANIISLISLGVIGGLFYDKKRES